MRLRHKEIAIIKEAVAQALPDAEVFLFGSRIDDTKRGGDIDLLIRGTEAIPDNTLGLIRIRLQGKLGEQKIDIIYHQIGTTNTLVDVIEDEAVKL